MSQSFSKRPRLPREFMMQHKRERVMKAVAAAIVEHGSYEAVHVGLIVKSAGVARNTFYEAFGSKEECFRAAVRWGFDLAVPELEAATKAPGGIDARIDATITAILEFLKGHPNLARICLFDAHAGAPEDYENGVQRLVELTGLPTTKGDLLVGGVLFTLCQHSLTSRPSFEELRPALRNFIAPAFSRELAAA